MRSIVFVVLAACDAGIVPLAPEVDATGGPIAGADDHWYAVVHLVRATEECSNLGGEHDTLEIDEPVHRLVHAGGHGKHLVVGATLDGMVPDRYFIAVLDRFGDAEPPIRNPGWCLDHMPSYYGHAKYLLPARDLADARRRLAEVAAHGIRE